MNSVLYSIFISLLLRMSIITVFILAIKAAFRYKLSAAMHSAIWLILAVQFAFCVFNVQIQADTSIYNYIPPETQEIISQTVQASRGGFDIRNTIAFLWFFGSAFLLIWYMFVYIRHRIELRRMPLVEDRETLKILADLKSELGIDSTITLRYGKTAETTSGTVIIPENFSPAELKQIMLHELCHYKNKDCLKLWLSIIIVSLNWFNPLIWYAFRVFRTDIEMLCDDRVIKLTDSRKCYATALVHSSMAKSRFIPGTTSLHNGKYEVTRRVKRLVSWKQKKPIWAVIAVFVCAGISCICLTDAVTIAVENSVDIASTPEPVRAVSDVIPIPLPAATEQPPAEVYAAESNAADVDVYSSSANTESSYPGGYTETAPDTYDVQTAETEDTPAVGIGAWREDVYGAMGEPESAAANGSKETYTLDDGSTIIVHYGENGTVERGYIIDAPDSSGSEEAASYGESDSAQ